MIPRGLYSNDWQGGLAVTMAARRAGEGSTVDRVISGMGGVAFEGIYCETLRIHPLTRGVAYVARRGQRQVVVQNSQVSEGYTAVWFDSLRFTPNGEALFFLAEHNGRTLFVVNGAGQREFEMVLEVQSHPPSKDGTADGLKVAAVQRGEIVWVTIQPQLLHFGLGRG